MTEISHQERTMHRANGHKMPEELASGHLSKMTGYYVQNRVADLTPTQSQHCLHGQQAPPRLPQSLLLG